MCRLISRAPIYSCLNLFTFFHFFLFFSFTLSSVLLFTFIHIRSFTLSYIHLSPVHFFTRSFIRSLSSYSFFLIHSLFNYCLPALPGIIIFFLHYENKLLAQFLSLKVDASVSERRPWLSLQKDVNIFAVHFMKFVRSVLTPDWFERF